MSVSPVVVHESYCQLVVGAGKERETPKKIARTPGAWICCYFGAFLSEAAQSQ